MHLTTTVKELRCSANPFEAFLSIRAHFGSGCFLLESVEGIKKTARFSIIGFKPIFSFKAKGSGIEVMNGGREKFESKRPFDELRKQFSRFSAEKIPTLAFSGGMVGYLSYDAVRYFENLPSELQDDLDLPDMHFIIPESVICFDHLHGKIYLISHGPADSGEIEKIMGQKHSAEFSLLKERSDFPKEEFEAAVEKAKVHIKAGDIFQAVLSRRVSFDFEGDEALIYKILRRINPSPYLFYLDFGDSKIMGSSPEMLVRLENGILTTRPIAGTRPRSEDVEEDEKLKIELLQDEKERAEHIMLVDLHRNDLGKVAAPGSVIVDELMGVEKYSHVQHIVSNVTAKLREGKDGFDALKACLPAGTVSGAPKIRAMELIEKFEKQRRGPYGGAVGYFDFSGNMDFAITIRSIIISGKRAHLQAGAGIVYDSIPEREFQETEAKMRAMVEAIRGASHEDIAD
ncbi:MAG: anthranilate synthase component I [Candidatus Micrarchaeota archaeon]